MIRFSAAMLFVLAGSASAIAQADAPLHVRVATIGSSGQAGVGFVVKKYGLDKKYGLEFDEIDYAAPGQQYTLLRSGVVDVAAGGFIDLLRQRAGGNGLRAFHGFQRYSMRIVVKPNSPIRSFADLKGKRLGEFGTTFLDWLIVRAAGRKAYGVDVEKDATAVQGAPPLLNQLLARDQVDATLQFPPLTFAAVARGEQRVLSTVPDIMKDAGFNPDCFYLQWFVSDQWSKTHPQMIEKLAAMFDEAYQKLATDDTVWAPLAQRIGIIDPQVVAAYRDFSRATDNPNYDRSLADATQTLLDSIVAVVGEQAVGVAKFDPEAFLFPRK
jgi:NitT/TauT family transport system substrate-binding protein